VSLYCLSLNGAAKSRVEKLGEGKVTRWEQKKAKLRRKSSEAGRGGGSKEKRNLTSELGN